MRTNTRQAFEAFQQGKAKRPAPSIWTNGDHLISYATEIACRMKDGRTLALCIQKFSTTTSAHQNGLKQLAAEAGLTVREYATEAEYLAAVTKRTR